MGNQQSLPKQTGVLEQPLMQDLSQHSQPSQRQSLQSFQKPQNNKHTHNQKNSALTRNRNFLKQHQDDNYQKKQAQMRNFQIINFERTQEKSWLTNPLMNPNLTSDLNQIVADGAQDKKVLQVQKTETQNQSTTSQNVNSSRTGKASQKGTQKMSKNIIRIQYTNGDTFEGNINQAKQRDGQGVYTCADRKRQSGYEYHGGWKENARDGKEGKCFYYNEEFYIGDWQYDQRHGQGDHFYKYEERYIGDWRYDMRHGKGTFISNGQSGSSSSGGGGHHHYEGRFKEDMRHGRGILKVTQNYQRYSTKQKEVKIYEQEWRSGKLAYQKKIHTVQGEDRIKNLMLNNEFIRYQTNRQMLLVMYARNRTGEINFYDNMKNHIDQSKLEKLLTRSPLFIHDDQGVQAQLQSENQLTQSEIVGSSKIKSGNDKVLHTEESQNRFRNKILDEIQPYFARIKDDPEKTLLVPELELRPEEQKRLKNLVIKFQSEPPAVYKWSSSDLLIFLLQQQTFQKSIRIIRDAFLTFRIDGDKFFRIKSEAEMLKVLGIQALGVRKNLMRFIRKIQSLEKKLEEERRQKILLEQYQKEQAKTRASYWWGGAPQQPILSENGSGRPKRGSKTEVETQVNDQRRQIETDLANIQQQNVQTSKSQDPQTAAGSGYTWGISNVPGGVYSVMSGISAYLYGTNPPKTDATKLDNQDQDAAVAPTEEEEKKTPEIVDNLENKEEEKEQNQHAHKLSYQSESQKFHDFDPGNFNLEKETEVMVPQEVGDQTQRQMMNDHVEIKTNNFTGIADVDDQFQLVTGNENEFLAEQNKRASQIVGPSNWDMTEQSSVLQQEGLSSVFVSQQIYLTNAGGKSQIIDSKMSPRKGQQKLADIHKIQDVKKTETKKESNNPLEHTGEEENDNSLKAIPGKILGTDFDALDIRDGVYGTQASPQNKNVKLPQLSPNGDSKKIELQNNISQQLQRSSEKFKQSAFQEKLLSGQNNEIFMKQHVGKMGQLKGVNLEKVRLSSTLKVDIKKSVPQAQPSPYDAALSHSSHGTSTFQDQKFSQLVTQNKKFQRDNSVQSHFEERFSNQRKQLLLARLNTSGSKRDRALSQGSFGNAITFEKKIQLDQPHLIDRDEIERIENELKERQKQIEMSKNLIDILFQTEKDKEREKLQKEKEKLKRGTNKNKNTSKLNSRGKRRVSEIDGSQNGDNFNENKQDGAQDAKNLDEDAYLYLIKTFNENGFSFYIDFNDLKFNYKTDFLGGGGYGEVFKAIWMATPVAVKRFGRKCISKKSIIDFIKEIEIVNQMRHPNIIFYMGVTFDEENHYYMVTELSSRGSIFDLLHSNNNSHSGSRGKVLLEDSKIFKIIKEMALAIQYLHTKKILHCDLKSQNILLTEDWTVKICDFGLARYQEKFVRDNNGKVGTPHWMAPEILRGERYTEAADVYSFGVILWELVTGDIPHRGRSVPQIIGSVGYYDEKLKLPSVSQSMPEETIESGFGNNSSLQFQPSNRHLRRVIYLCTQHDPHKRPTFAHILQYIDHLELQLAYHQNLEQQKIWNQQTDLDELKTAHTDAHLRNMNYIKNQKNKQFFEYFQKLVEL